MAVKRYRAKPYLPGVLRMYWGVMHDDPHNPDIVINRGAGCASPDGHLLYGIFCLKRPFWDYQTNTLGHDKSLMDELILRGYDITTLQFSIKKKETP